MKLKAYVGVPYGLSIAMTRVANALARYAPDDVETVPRPDERADVIVLPAVSFPDVRAVTEELRARKQPYAIIQYCLNTSGITAIADWLPIWQEAEAVWSYYDLHAALRNGGGPDGLFNFYHAPLGVDFDTFRPSPYLRKPYALFTSGYVASTECVTECCQATSQLGLRQFHLGPRHLALTDSFWTGTEWVRPTPNQWMELPGHVDSATQITDEELAIYYSKAQFVTGLRRGEGFEMPVTEGAACGARPICFDRTHYRMWFEEFSVFIPEGDPASVTASLVEVLREGAQPISDEEHELIRDRFDWGRIASGFWRCLARQKQQTGAAV